VPLTTCNVYTVICNYEQAIWQRRQSDYAADSRHQSFKLQTEYQTQQLYLQLTAVCTTFTPRTWRDILIEPAVRRRAGIKAWRAFWTGGVQNWGRNRAIKTNRVVGWLEFNVPFQHKYGYIRDENRVVATCFLCSMTNSADGNICQLPVTHTHDSNKVGHIYLKVPQTKVFTAEINASAPAVTASVKLTSPQC